MRIFTLSVYNFILYAILMGQMHAEVIDSGQEYVNIGKSYNSQLQYPLQKIIQQKTSRSTSQNIIQNTARLTKNKDKLINQHSLKKIQLLSNQANIVTKNINSPRSQSKGKERGNIKFSSITSPKESFYQTQAKKKHKKPARNLNSAKSGDITDNSYDFASDIIDTEQIFRKMQIQQNKQLKKIQEEQNQLFKLIEKQMQSISYDIEQSGEDNGLDSKANVTQKQNGINSFNKNIKLSFNQLEVNNENRQQLNNSDNGSKRNQVKNNTDNKLNKFEQSKNVSKDIEGNIQKQNKQRKSFLDEIIIYRPQKIVEAKLDVTETKPVEIKPSEVKAVEPKIVEAKLDVTETKPVEIKPSEVKAVEPKIIEILLNSTKQKQIFISDVLQPKIQQSESSFNQPIISPPNQTSHHQNNFFFNNSLNSISEFNLQNKESNLFNISINQQKNNQSQKSIYEILSSRKNKRKINPLHLTQPLLNLLQPIKQQQFVKPQNYKAPPQILKNTQNAQQISLQRNINQLIKNYQSEVPDLDAQTSNFNFNPIYGIECIIKNGNYQKAGKAGNYHCIRYFKDAFLTCYSSQQCEGDCIIRDYNSQQAVCQLSDSLYGCWASIQQFAKTGKILCRQ